MDLRKATRAELVDEIDRLAHFCEMDQHLIRRLADMIGLSEEQFDAIVDDVATEHGWEGDEPDADQVH